MSYQTLRKDPDFFANVYNYYVKGGFSCIFVENVLNIVITLVTLMFAMFLFFHLNWKQISECESETTCFNLGTYVMNPKQYHSNATSAFMIIFIIIFAIYWLWLTFALVKDFPQFVKYREFFRSELKIKSDELEALKWTDIVTALLKLDGDLTVDQIVGSIMRKDNYLIAMVSNNIFDINPIFYTKVFLWMIDVCVFSQIFGKMQNFDSSGNFEVKPDDIRKIKFVLKILGFVQILFLPFTLMITIIHYTINVTTDIYTRKSYFGPKEWTLHAKIVYREYNELPHIFNERIAKSYKYAVQFEQKFNAHFMNIVIEKIIFWLGTYLTTLVIIALYDERWVMYINIFDRNLLWYLAILTSVVTLLRMVTVEKSTSDESAEELMEKMSKHTHYFPLDWKRNCHQYFVLKQFKLLFQYKITGVLTELLGIVVVPFYMTLTISDCVDVVAHFVKNNTVRDQFGYQCKYGIMNGVVEIGNVRDDFSNSSDSSDFSNFSRSDVRLLIDSQTNDKLDDKNKRSRDNYVMYYAQNTERTMNESTRSVQRDMQRNADEMEMTSV